jgi:hypothetical protein
MVLGRSSFRENDTRMGGYYYNSSGRNGLGPMNWSHFGLDSGQMAGPCEHGYFKDLKSQNFSESLGLWTFSIVQHSK